MSKWLLTNIQSPSAVTTLRVYCPPVERLRLALPVFPTAAHPPRRQGDRRLAGIRFPLESRERPTLPYPAVVLMPHCNIQRRISGCVGVGRTRQLRGLDIENGGGGVVPRRAKSTLVPVAVLLWCPRLAVHRLWCAGPAGPNFNGCSRSQGRRARKLSRNRRAGPSELIGSAVDAPVKFTELGAGPPDARTRGRFGKHGAGGGGRRATTLIEPAPTLDVLHPSVAATWIEYGRPAERFSVARRRCAAPADAGGREAHRRLARTAFIIRRSGGDVAGSCGLMLTFMASGGLPVVQLSS